MDVLADLFAPDQRRKHEDFVRRYEEGPPWAGFDDDEAYQEYESVAPRLSESDYRDSAREAFERLTPEQRREFGRWLQEQSRQKGVAIPDLDGGGVDDRLADSGYLADATSRLNTQQPGFLDGLFGGASGGRGGLGGFLNSPIGKAVIGGIAAMAFSRLMRR
jgi:hypothetical protein